MNKTVAWMAAAAALALNGGIAAAAGKPDAMMAADSMKWEDGPAPGTHVVKLWGDMMKGGPYGVLVKFDAGLMHELHHHTHTLKIVVLSGTFLMTPEGGTESRLGPGSYLESRGKNKHVSGCAPGAECEFFMSSDAKFDMIEEKAAQKKDAPAAEKKK